MKPTTIVTFGGPWYGSKLDTRLCVSLIQLVTEGAKAGIIPDRLINKDGMLDLSRNQLLAEALAAPCDWLLSIDADCSFINQTSALGDALERWNAVEVALVAAPALCGNHGGWNVREPDGSPVTNLTPGPVARIGFGLVAFRLAWYREHWKVSLAPFFQTVVQGDGCGNYKSTTEDYGHCDEVRRRGGLVICEPRIRIKHHVTRAGHPLSVYE